MRLGDYWDWCGLNLVCYVLSYYYFLFRLGTARCVKLLKKVLTVTADLLILGLGKEMRPISPRTRQFINSLGIRVDIQDTRNAAAQFNLLATERGISTIAAALIPLGFREGVGIQRAGGT